MDTIAEELEVHAQLEEEIFYPAMRGVSSLVDHAREEHHQVRTLIGAAEGRDPGSPEFSAKVVELTSLIQRGIRGMKLAAKKVA